MESIIKIPQVISEFTCSAKRKRDAIEMNRGELGGMIRNKNMHSSKRESNHILIKCKKGVNNEYAEKVCL